MQQILFIPEKVLSHYPFARILRRQENIMKMDYCPGLKTGYYLKDFILPIATQMLLISVQQLKTKFFILIGNRFPIIFTFSPFRRLFSVGSDECGVINQFL